MYSGRYAPLGHGSCRVRVDLSVAHAALPASALFSVGVGAAAAGELLRRVPIVGGVSELPAAACGPAQPLAWSVEFDA